MDTAELSRLIENLIRTGTVSAVDHAQAKCRVKIGKLDTEWLPFFARRAGETATWCPPTEGEQVVVFSPSGELASGLVLTGLYSTAKPAPSHSEDEHVTQYPDGAVIRYNHASGALEATGIKTGLIQASDLCTIDCPENIITGNTLIKGTLTVEKLLTYMAGMKGTGGGGASAEIDGNIKTTGNINAEGDVSAGDISLRKHKTSGVKHGDEVSAEPVP